MKDKMLTLRIIALLLQSILEDLDTGESFILYKPMFILKIKTNAMIFSLTTTIRKVRIHPPCLVVWYPCPTCVSHASITSCFYCFLISCLSSDPCCFTKWVQTISFLLLFCVLYFGELWNLELCLLSMIGRTLWHNHFGLVFSYCYRNIQVFNFFLGNLNFSRIFFNST